MQPITKEYLLLFNAITDACTTLSELVEKLKTVQQITEEIYISKKEEHTVHLHPLENPGTK